MGGSLSRAWRFQDMTTRNKKRPQAAYGDFAFEQGITALTVLSRLHGKAVSPDDIRRRCREDRSRTRRALRRAAVAMDATCATAGRGLLSARQRAARAQSDTSEVVVGYRMRPAE